MDLQGRSLNYGRRRDQAVLKTFARGLGLEPEKVLTQAAFAEPHRTYAIREDRETAQTRALTLAIKELIKKELLAAKEVPQPANSPTQR